MTCVKSLQIADWSTCSSNGDKCIHRHLREGTKQNFRHHQNQTTFPLRQNLHSCTMWRCSNDYRYRDGLWGRPYVAINFFMARPGCCLAKQAHLLVHLCTLIIDRRRLYFASFTREYLSFIKGSPQSDKSHCKGVNLKVASYSQHSLRQCAKRIKDAFKM